MAARLLRAFGCVLVVASSCSDGVAPRFVDQGDASTAPDAARGPCQSNADCDDGVRCTRDLCVVGGACEHLPADATCVVPTRCASNAECDDRNVCTRDRCLVDGTCSHTPIDLCASDASAPDAFSPDASAPDVVSDVSVDASSVDVVAPRGCSSDGECDDHRRCDGVERCVSSMCVAGAAVTCDDGDACTVDSCNETGAAMCVNAPIASCAAVTPIAGSWALTPPPGYACQDDVFKTTVIDLRATTSLTLSITGSAITVTGVGPTLTGALTGNTFRLSGRTDGGCVATVTLAAALSDPRHFAGAIDLAFAGPDCILSSCEAQHLTVSGALSM